MISGNGQSLLFRPPRLSPLTGTSATVIAKVVSEGGQSVGANYGVYCTLTKEDAPTANAAGLTVTINAGSTASRFSATITGLQKGTTYHVRAFATNTSFGTGYGGDCEFFSE